MFTEIGNHNEIGEHNVLFAQNVATCLFLTVETPQAINRPTIFMRL